MTKQCELCDLPAQLFCESDRASLCRDCDAKVHGANFLVARHLRTLLCRSCQAPTPWRASGSRLGFAASVCERCLGHKSDAGDCTVEQEELNGDGGGGAGRSGWVEDGVNDSGSLVEDDSEEDDDDEDEEEDQDEDEDGDGDNQVVPWSTEADATPAPPSPPAASCSTSQEESSGATDACYGSLKRRRESDDLSSSHDDLACSLSAPGYLRFSPLPPPAAAAACSLKTREEDETEEEEASASTRTGHSFRPLKRWQSSPAGPTLWRVSPAGGDLLCRRPPPF